MAIGDNIRVTDRTLLNVAIVAVVVALGLGITFIATGWPIAKTALFIASPIALIAVFGALVRAWWPRDEV